MMTEQRAFWISGLGSLAVVVLLGSALWARTKPADSNLTTQASSSASVPLDLMGSEQDPLREELKVAYNDLNTAYREIDRLRDTNKEKDSDDDDDDESKGDRDGINNENDDHR